MSAPHIILDTLPSLRYDTIGEFNVDWKAEYLSIVPKIVRFGGSLT